MFSKIIAGAACQYREGEWQFNISGLRLPELTKLDTLLIKEHSRAWIDVELIAIIAC